jgi:hypothetical protein
MTTKQAPLSICSLAYISKGSTAISEPSFVDVWNLLDILQYCGDRGKFPHRLYSPAKLTL